MKFVQNLGAFLCYFCAISKLLILAELDLALALLELVLLKLGGVHLIADLAHRAEQVKEDGDDAESLEHQAYQHGHASNGAHAALGNGLVTEDGWVPGLPGQASQSQLLHLLSGGAHAWPAAAAMPILQAAAPGRS